MQLLKKSICRVLGNHSFQLFLFIIINLSHMTETFHFLKILFFNSICLFPLFLSLFRWNDTYVFPNWRCESHYHADAASHLILKEIVLFKKKQHFLLKSSIPFISNKQRDLNFKISLIDQRRDESKHSIFMCFIYHKRMVKLFIRTQFKVWSLQR